MKEEHFPLWEVGMTIMMSITTILVFLIFIKLY